MSKLPFSNVSFLVISILLISLGVEKQKYNIISKCIGRCYALLGMKSLLVKRFSRFMKNYAHYVSELGPLTVLL